MKFLTWATSKDLALDGIKANITMARDSVWDDPAAKQVMNPELADTRSHAAKMGYPYDRPFMTSVGKARDLIGEVIIESINSKGTSAKIEPLAKKNAAAVDDLLKADGEYK
jgi:multiple sugar transport system substrate-binding protein